MKTLLSLITLSFFLISSNSQAQDYKGQDPYLTKNMDGITINKVDSKTSGGNISVIGGSDKPKVEVYISSNNNHILSKEEIESRLNKYYILKIEVNSGTLIARAEQKGLVKSWSNGNSLNISFKIYVPETVSSEIKTSGGNIVLKDLKGSTENFNTSGGNLSVEQLSGEINGNTSGGNINIVNATGKIMLTTSGGNIDAENCSGTMGLKTSGGNLNLNSLSGTIEAKTSGGDIHGSTIQGDLLSKTSGGSIHLDNLNCSLETETSGGDIHVAMVGLGKFIKIENSAGDIDLALPKNTGMTLAIKADKINTNDLQNFNGSQKEGELNGSYHGGGIPVSAHTSSGKVNLSFE